MALVREDILGLRRELTGQGYWKFEHSFTPGLQEYIEAVTFLHYLLHGTIPSREALSADLKSVDPANVEGTTFPSDFVISVKDYLLGVAGSSIFSKFSLLVAVVSWC